MFAPVKSASSQTTIKGKPASVCIEPANCGVGGIEVEHKNGTLEYLEPFEKKEINIEIEVLDNYQEIQECQNYLESLDSAAY